MKRAKPVFRDVPDPRMGLTVCQRECLSFVESYLAEHDGVCPTILEIAGGLGKGSTNRIHANLVALEERGFIRRIKNRARAIEVLKSSRPRIPIYDADTHAIRGWVS